MTETYCACCRTWKRADLFSTTRGSKRPLCLNCESRAVRGAASKRKPRPAEMTEQRTTKVIRHLTRYDR